MCRKLSLPHMPLKHKFTAQWQGSVVIQDHFWSTVIHSLQSQLPCLNFLSLAWIHVSSNFVSVIWWELSWLWYLIFYFDDIVIVNFSHLPTQNILLHSLTILCVMLRRWRGRQTIFSTSVSRTGWGALPSRRWRWGWGSRLVYQTWTLYWWHSTSWRPRLIKQSWTRSNCWGSEI